MEEALVDRALERVLLQKCELGLLDADWAPEPADDEEIELDDAESRALAGQARAALDRAARQRRHAAAARGPAGRGGRAAGGRRPTR